jgi:hypothetical protein
MTNPFLSPGLLIFANIVTQIMAETSTRHGITQAEKFKLQQSYTFTEKRARQTKEVAVLSGKSIKGITNESSLIRHESLESDRFMNSYEQQTSTQKKGSDETKSLSSEYPLLVTDISRLSGVNGINDAFFFIGVCEPEIFTSSESVLSPYFHTTRLLHSMNALLFSAGWLKNLKYATETRVGIVITLNEERRLQTIDFLQNLLQSLQSEVGSSNMKPIAVVHVDSLFLRSEVK